MSRHLTRRFWCCLYGGTVGLLLGAFLQSSYLVAVVLPLVIAVVLSVVDGWWPRLELGAVTVSSPRVVIGDEVTIQLEVLCNQRVDLLDVELQFSGGLRPVTPARMVGPVSPGSTSYDFRFEAQHWGVHGPEHVSISATDRFGMSLSLLRVALSNPVRVHPPTEDLRVLLGLEHTRTMAGDHRSQRRGGGTEVATIRSYAAGDSIGNVHPRLSARRGEPYVVDRHPEQASDVVLFVDSVQDLGSGLDSSLRWTVTAAMALARRHGKATDRVGILDRGAGVRWLQPGMGRRAQHTIVDVLLNTRTLTPRTSDHQVVPVAALPRGAAVFALSPLVSTVVYQDLVMLRRRGHEVVVVQPQPRSRLQASDLARRVSRIGNEIRRRTLSDVGVLVLPWDPEDSLEQTIRQGERHVARQRAAVGRSQA